MINHIPLPPKRYEAAEDSVFDPIRSKLWFKDVVRRRVKLPALRNARKEWLESPGFGRQADVCRKWGVSTREYRDYSNFAEGAPGFLGPTLQKALNDAYQSYCGSGGLFSWRQCVLAMEGVYGIKRGALWTLWEIKPDSYPSSYPDCLKPKRE